MVTGWKPGYVDRATRRSLRDFRRLRRHWLADVVFLEAPVDRDEMRAFCSATQKPSLANMLEGGHTPRLAPSELEELGYKIVAYPLTLLNASIVAMQRALEELRRGDPPSGLLPFSALRTVVGFDAYDAESARYRFWQRACWRACGT